MSSVKTQPKLTVHVLCSGIRYGLGENRLYELFKAAWLQNPGALSYSGKGENLIPTIHVIDLARLTRRMVQAGSAKTAQDKAIHAKQYIFAIDRTSRPTQKKLIEGISRGIGTGKTNDRGIDAYSHLPIDQKEFLMINLKMRASDAFKDGEVPEDAAEEADEIAKKLKFPWHCEKGIIENIRRLNEEFNTNRGLHPVKIFITGPPASGKTYYSERIANYYNIPRVHAKELVQRAFALSKFEEGQGTELGEEIRAKIEELKDAIVAQIEEARQALGDDAGEPEEIDREKLSVRLTDEILFKILRIRLTENDCRNRGYILDGFPKNYKQAQEVFLYRPKKLDENGEEIVEDEPELEEGEEKSYDGFVIREDIFPKSFILLDAKESNDNLLLKRVKDNLREQEAFGTHYNSADMDRRLKAYRIANNSQVAEPSLKNFFSEKGGLQLQEELDCTSTSTAVSLKSFKIYIERFEKPFNYMTFDQQDEKVHVAQERVVLDSKAQLTKQAVEREEIVEKEVRKQKEAYTKHRLEQIKEYERDVLDAKSQPIRQYLMDNLVPILTEGLLEICKRTPTDPVDYLAEYLFRRSLDVPYPDPTSY